MKQKVTKAIALVCAAVAMGSTFAACQPGSGGILGGQSMIDRNKTQLYVGNYDGGFGSDWLDTYKVAFEEMYKEVSFEEGKKGVEVVLVKDKVAFYSGNLIQTIDASNIDIIFTEEFAYYDYVKPATGGASYLYDITEWVNETLPGETRSIADKMNDRQKTYYTGYDGQYYGVPHFQSLRGLIYDVDLFNENSLFIKADGSISGKSTDTDLSTGPDGKAGTYDDGLPATYEQMWEWCDFVSTYKNITPFCWTGAYKDDYSKYLESALIADTLGSNAAQFFYSQSANTEVEVDLIRSWNADGTPVITRETISRENSLDMCMAAAGYYMLDFWKQILDNNWYYNMSLNTLTTHDIIHYDYLRSRFDDSIQPIAFMIEGAWWEHESEYIFEDLAKTYENASRMERTFGYLGLPKARQEYVGKDMTLVDANNSICVVNANIKGRPEEQIAKLFFQFIHSDENIQLFNLLTGIARDFDVNLTSEQKATLSPFCKQLTEVRENAEGLIVYAHENSYEDKKYAKLNASGVDFRSAVNLSGDVWYGVPLSVFTTDGTKNMTAKEYFKNVYNKYY